MKGMNALHPDRVIAELRMKASIVWPAKEMQTLEESFVRHGMEPPKRGDLDWLKRINDLIEEIERKA